MFLDRERYLYRKPQLVEVICQLRFPTILSISPVRKQLKVESEKLKVVVSFKLRFER